MKLSKTKTDIYQFLSAALEADVKPWVYLWHVCFTVQLRNWHGLQWNEYHVVVQWVKTGIFEE